LEIRSRDTLKEKYNLYPDKVFPKVQCLPVYKRNGFKGRFGALTPYELFGHILTNSRAETLLKANQFALLAASIGYNHGHQVSRYWNSVKICLRNNYVVKD